VNRKRVVSMILSVIMAGSIFVAVDQQSANASEKPRVQSRFLLYYEAGTWFWKHQQRTCTDSHCTGWKLVGAPHLEDHPPKTKPKNASANHPVLVKIVSGAKAPWKK
jgi:hypothetical protein